MLGERIHRVHLQGSEIRLARNSPQDRREECRKPAAVVKSWPSRGKTHKAPAPYSSRGGNP